MHTFLEEQAKLIFGQFNDEISDISIIIPNKRAAVYLQKYLADLYKKPIFSPEIITINEWVDGQTNERILSGTELLFTLFTVHQRIEKDKSETFDQFSQWGKILLSDFDEIDRYLIEPNNIFRDLRAIKEIENWSFDSEQLSSGQEKFKTLWDKLPEYYQRFNDLLASEHQTYGGKAYRKFLENLKNVPKKSHYIFLGFNAISKVEQEIMRHLRKEGLATIIFDVDEFYVNNDSHEAGYFYRKICKAWNEPIRPNNHFNSIPKKIEVIETSQQIAQVKIAGDLIRQIKANGKISETAIVLADESLLIPLMNALPAINENNSRGKVNITMGYPIKFSHLKGLVDLAFDFQFNYEKFKSGRIYHKPLQELIQHPYIKLLIDDQLKIDAFQTDLTNRNIIFLEEDELWSKFPKLKKVKALFTTWPQHADQRIQCFDALVDALHLQFQKTEDKSIDHEILYHFSKALKKFKDIWSIHKIEFNLRTFKQLFHQFWQNESLSFLGNPTDGLQLMGILETRTLDFKNLIILGMNEGSLPKSNITNSMIPRDLRNVDQQLPTEEDRQAIFAHHFYRLIQRASTIHMTYNSHSEGLGSGEQSRFLIQLENEVNSKYGHSFQRHTYSPTDENAITSDPTYKSTPEVQAHLDALLERGLSPSAFNKLISCPLDFYYRYIIGLDEEGEIEENIESSTFGTKIHHVLEAIIRDNFLKDGKPTPFSITALKAEKKKIKERLTFAYLESDEGKKFSANDLKYGQNKLSFDVSLDFIQGFIDLQIKEIKDNPELAIMPVSLEETLSTTFKTNIKGVEKTVSLKGKADRIDKIGSTYRIIDYKSGKCEDKKVSFSYSNKTENITKMIKSDDKSYARQLLMYALMFQQKYPQVKEFTAGIISMINLNQWIQNVRPGKTANPIIEEDLLEQFKDGLIDYISQMYDDDFVFEHDISAKYCQHCNK
ncbi:MAG: PD-(D/E)XK nuclease family protein [Crocinitomicaceae bacterium]